MRGWQMVSVAYGVLASLSCALVLAVRRTNALDYPSAWLALDEPLRTGSSVVLGVAFAVLVVSTTRISVRRWEWARRLHAELRPVAHDAPSRTLITVAVLSSVGEELFFRGLLMPFLGVVVQAVVFGVAHQVRGKSRWVWVTWATVVGLGLGAIFGLTGSLIGAVTSHALVNAHNLIFLRDHDPGRGRGARLGGLMESSRV